MDRTTWGILFVGFLCLLGISAIFGGFLIAHLLIKFGLYGHPQCQPSVKKSRRGYFGPAITTQQLPKIINREYTLMEANGPISDRLRKQFDKDDPAWNPPRDETEPEKKPLPKGRDGWGITGRGKK